MTPNSLFCALHPWRQFLVAFSGGLDSTVLLHQLVQLRDAHPDVTVRAIHIHHGLSPNADAWVAHCRAVCERWNVALHVQYVTLPKSGGGIEAEARRARYSAFAAALQPGEALLTGQHRDDQCETLLLALKRGSGPAGLAAMPARMAFAGGELIRPLLPYSRADVAQCASAHQLCWIEDESNHSARFERNFLRLEVLPILTARWPHFADAAARSAALCGEQEQLLDELLAEELQQLVDSRGALRIDPMKPMSEMRRAALLRRWLSLCGATMPARAALVRIWQEVALSRDDANPALQLGDAEVRRYQGALWWVKARPEVSIQPVAWLSPWTPLALPGGTLSLTAGTGQAVRAPRENERVTVRYRAPGLLHIVGRDRGRTLKKLWQELGVPPWQRAITPLLFYGEQLIAAPGVFVTREGAPQGKDMWWISWVPNEKV